MQFEKFAVVRIARSVATTLAVATSLTMSPLLVADAPFMSNGTDGFVVADIKYALAEDAENTGACPKGMSRHAEEIFALTPAGKRREGESDEQYSKRLDAGAMKLSTAPNGLNV